MTEQTEFDTVAFKALLDKSGIELLMGMWLTGYIVKQDDIQMARMLHAIISKIMMANADLPDDMKQKLNLYCFGLEKKWWPQGKEE